MFPLIFSHLCSHTISFVQHFTWTHLYMRNMCKHIFEEECFVRSKFSCVRSSHNLWAHAHAHSLEGILDRTKSPVSQSVILIGNDSRALIKKVPNSLTLDLIVMI